MNRPTLQKKWRENCFPPCFLCLTCNSRSLFIAVKQVGKEVQPRVPEVKEEVEGNQWKSKINLGLIVVSVITL
jgi:hypothetical protein